MGKIEYFALPRYNPPNYIEEEKEQIRQFCKEKGIDVRRIIGMPENDKFYPLLKPYIDEVDRLNRILEKKETRIEQLCKRVDSLEKQNSDLLFEHENSGLERDKPLMAKWSVEEYGDGKKFTIMFCPKCGKMVSNWQGYCELCGQRLSDKFEYLPENEIHRTGGESNVDKTNNTNEAGNIKEE